MSSESNHSRLKMKSNSKNEIYNIHYIYKFNSNGIIEFATSSV